MTEPSLEIKYFLICRGDENVQDMKAFSVEGLDDLEMYVTISIGEIGSTGAEDFNLMILCGETPRIRHAAKRAKRESVKYKLFASIDMNIAENWIRDRVMKCDAGSYAASLPCLRRNFDWEFEGCKPVISQ